MCVILRLRLRQRCRVTVSSRGQITRILCVLNWTQLCRSGDSTSNTTPAGDTSAFTASNYVFLSPRTISATSILVLLPPISLPDRPVHANAIDQKKPATRRQRVTRLCRLFNPPTPPPPLSPPLSLSPSLPLSLSLFFFHNTPFLFDMQFNSTRAINPASITARGWPEVMLHR